MTAFSTVIGVSPDSIKNHKSFKEKQSLNFILLSDTEHKLAEAYGVWKEKSMYSKKYMGIERSTFIIDKDGKTEKNGAKSKSMVTLTKLLTIYYDNFSIYNLKYLSLFDKILSKVELKFLL